MGFLKKEYDSINIKSIRRLYNKISEEDALIVLKYYTETEIIDAIRKLGFLDLRKLASLIIWLTKRGLQISRLGLVEEPETGQPQFIAVYIEGCGWDEWRRLSRQVKKQLVDEGLDDVAGRVALVCSQAL